MKIEDYTSNSKQIFYSRKICHKDGVVEVEIWMTDRKITPERRAYLEKKYGGNLPDKPPTLLERWEKEGEMYRKCLKKSYTKNENVDK